MDYRIIRNATIIIMKMGIETTIAIPIPDAAPLKARETIKTKFRTLSWDKLELNESFELTQYELEQINSTNPERYLRHNAWIIGLELRCKFAVQRITKTNKLVIFRITRVQ